MTDTGKIRNAAPGAGTPKTASRNLTTSIMRQRKEFVNEMVQGSN